MSLPSTTAHRLAGLLPCLLLLGASAPAEQPKPPAEPELPLTLVAGGDVTLGYHFQELFDAETAHGKPAKEVLAYPFANVKQILEGADLAVVNLECPFTERGEKITKNFNFRASPALAEALVMTGIDVVSLANNHMMDYGPLGVEDTLETLDKMGVAHFGAGRSLAEARAPAIVERRGVKLGFLGYFFLGDANIEPKIVHAAEGAPGVAGTHKEFPPVLEMVKADVAALKGKVDLVIPFFHWGRENEHQVAEYQVTLAHAAIDAGASLVLGSHPHVLQGMELYKGAPIVYSLGNFVFGGNSNPGVKDSALYVARISKGGVLSSQVIPIQITKLPEAPYQPFLLTGDAAARVRQNLVAYSKILASPLPGLLEPASFPPSPVAAGASPAPGASAAAAEPKSR